MNQKHASIYLVGMMGSGKSTIGKVLARSLNMPFMDLDHQIESKCGVKIPLIFEIEGEEGFRKREAQVLEEVTRQTGIVMATGGGAILQEHNRALLRERGIVVYLKASVEELYRRTCRDRNRPLLATQDPKARLREILADREALYDEVADIIMETSSSTVTSVAHKLIERINQYRDFQCTS
ncbi:shikimate kinase AroK [Orrella marina]|uniref:Shikimate kinase n=1 Tax=Orrella marina TaxID=2163011 RepID=A0A2R4XLI2_9BURK|nr:shikimate kinase AroK [Orrella marina]AWB34634.1 shikimate kinase AroK [Orrella marina]